MNQNEVIDILNANADNPMAAQLIAEFKNLPQNDDFTRDSKAFEEFMNVHKKDFEHLDSRVVENEKPTTPVSKQIQDFADNIDFLDANPVYKVGLAKRFGISVDELDKELSKITAAKEYQAGKDRRKKEIEDAGFISPWTLASDYSKQRYIENPDNSIFGKEGNFNPYSTEGQKELRDVILGGSGAVADAMPGVGGIVLGPAIRSGRDIAHKVDNDQASSWSDIGVDFGTDAMFNAGTQLLPTAILRQTGKLGEGGAQTIGGHIADAAHDASHILESEAEDKAIIEGLKQNSWLGNENIGKTAAQNLNEKEAAKQISRMPDSPLKRELEAARTWQEKLDIIAKYNQELTEEPGSHELYDVLGGRNWENYRRTKNTYGQTLADRALDREMYNNPDKLTRAMMYGSKAFSIGGEPIVKEAKTATGRGSEHKETDVEKHERWQKGYATWDEMKSSDYQKWYKDNMEGLAK